MSDLPDNQLGPKPFGLNARQRLFAEGIDAGLSKREAYEKAGYLGGSKSSRNSQISTMFNLDKVQRYLSWLAARKLEGAVDLPPDQWALGQMRSLALTAKSDTARVQAVKLYGGAVGQDWGGTGDEGYGPIAKVSSAHLVAIIRDGIGGEEGQSAARKMAKRLGVELPPMIEATAVEGVSDGRTVQ